MPESKAWMKGAGTLGLGDGHWKARLRGRVSESEVWSVHDMSILTGHDCLDSPPVQGGYCCFLHHEGCWMSLSASTLAGWLPDHCHCYHPFPRHVDHIGYRSAFFWKC